MDDAQHSKEYRIKPAEVPAFSAALERDLAATVTRRLGHPPTAGQLAAYRLYLYTVAEELLRRVEVALRAIPPTSPCPEPPSTPADQQTPKTSRFKASPPNSFGRATSAVETES
jgi:hypothetical protein